MATTMSIEVSCGYTLYLCKTALTSTAGNVRLDKYCYVLQRLRRRKWRLIKKSNKSIHLLVLYWELGESICRKQEEFGRGRSVVENLARDLKAEFPGRNGFPAQNIWLMRRFYLENRDKPILAPMVREIGRTRNRVILGRCKATWDVGAVVLRCARAAAPLREFGAKTAGAAGIHRSGAIASGGAQPADSVQQLDRN